MRLELLDQDEKRGAAVPQVRNAIGEGAGMNDYKEGHTGPGLLSLLLVVFITLKLVDKIDWSWWWVLAPLWGPFALFAVVLVPVLAWAWYEGEL